MRIVLAAIGIVFAFWLSAFVHNVATQAGTRAIREHTAEMRLHGKVSACIGERLSWGDSADNASWVCNLTYRS